MSYVEYSERFGWIGCFTSIGASLMSGFSTSFLNFYYPHTKESKMECKVTQFLTLCHVIIAIVTWVPFITAVLSMTVSLVAMLANKGIKRRVLEEYKIKYKTAYKAKKRRYRLNMNAEDIEAYGSGGDLSTLLATAWSLYLEWYLYKDNIIDWYPMGAHIINAFAAIFSMVTVNFFTKCYIIEIREICERIRVKDRSINPNFEVANEDDTSDEVRAQEEDLVQNPSGDEGSVYGETEAAVDEPRPSHGLWRRRRNVPAQEESSTESASDDDE